MVTHSELLFPFITYAVVTSITPGPNNITSTSAGMKFGYRKTLPYLLGIALGFLAVLTISGLLTDFIVTLYSSFSPVLKWIGIIYMLWLAAVPFVYYNKSGKAQGEFNYSFLSGILLQFINIKGILYGITIYSTFSPLIGSSRLTILASSLFLTVICFGCISFWTLLGSSFSRYFENKRFYFIFNGLMALLLMYSAVSILQH